MISRRAAPVCPCTGAGRTHHSRTCRRCRRLPGRRPCSVRCCGSTAQPLADLRFEIDGRVAYSDARGQFLLRLEHHDTQHHELLIDGSTATAGGHTYGLYEVGVMVTGGRTTVLRYTVWMTPLDTAHAMAIPSPTTSEVVVTTPRIPGLEVRIPPGTLIRDHEGAVVCELSITPIPIDQPPFPLPPDLEVPVYFTIQPGGAYLYTSGINVRPGARLIFPNGLGFPDGKRMAFWRYEADGRGWYVYGQGTVRATQIGPVDVGEHEGDSVDVAIGLSRPPSSRSSSSAWWQEVRADAWEWKAWLGVTAWYLGMWAMAKSK